jgi:ssDNA-binding Zn-finger/Zn-ribbon topoisomerase 1
MAEQETSAEREHPAAFVCQSCGARFRGTAQGPPGACPQCRRKSVRRLEVRGGALDYALADRRQGTTAEDVAFAQWAKWAGFITANQYNTAMHLQNGEVRDTGKGRPIHDVLVSLGFLDKDKVEGLLRFLAVERPNRNDKDFAARVLRHGWAEPDRVESVFALQRRLAGRRNEVRPLAQMLVHKRVLSEGRMLELLHEQEKDGIGNLTLLRSMAERPHRQRAVSKLGARLVGSRLPLRGVALLVLLAAVAYGVWAWQLSPPKIFAYGRCTRCQSVVRVRWSATDWPRRCPVCRHKTVLYLVRCPQGHYFLRSSPFSKEPCPECGSDFGRQPTPEEFERLRR